MRAILALSAVAAVALGAMVGGWTIQNASDPEFMDRAWQSVKGSYFDSSNEGPHHWMPIKVLNAKSKVVAGVSYELEILFGESTCKKGDVAATELSAENCKLKEDPRRVIYKVAIWEKPWENFQQFNVEKLRNVEANENL